MALAMSLTSYLSSYKVDESAIVANGLPNVAVDTVDNSAGPLGAEVGAFFFDKLFGYGSFLFVLIFGSLGVNLLLRKKIFRVTKILVYCILTMVWFSIMATYIQSAFDIDSGLSWGGAFGEFFTGMDGIIMKNLKKF